MDVFVIPIGPDRYELYCESPVEAPQPAPGSSGIVGRIRYRFAVMLHQAEERRRSGAAPSRADSYPICLGASPGVAAMMPPRIA